MVNYLKEGSHVFFKKNMMPQFIVLYVTDACNLTCRHCFYYADLNKANTIPFQDLEKLSKSITSVVNISFTGGEPFIRADFPKVVKLFYDNSNLAVASIPTNGTLARKTVQGADQMCTECPNLAVNITVSLDGQEKTHDYIRMKEGGFQKSKETLRQLCELKKKHKNLNVGVICTINEANEDEIKPLFDEINNEMDINQFQINFIRGETKELKPAASTLKKYKQVNAYIHDKLLEKEYKGYRVFFSGLYNAIIQRQKKVITDTLEKNKFITQCYAGTSNCIIFPNGVVSACEIRTDVGMGNLKDFDWNLQTLIKAKRAQDVRREILPSKCFCSFECQSSSNIAYNPKQLALSFMDLVKMKLGIMKNHFDTDELDEVEVNTKLRFKDKQGKIKELNEKVHGIGKA